MIKNVIFSFLLGLALGALIAPFALARSNEETTTEHGWCYRGLFDSNEQLDEHSQGDESFDYTFIKPNGSKMWVYTKCEVTPLPHRYSPY